MKQTTQRLSRLKQLVARCTKTFKPLLLVAVSCLMIISTTSAADEQEVLASLKSGTHFAIMRHALAPGSGDPSKFDLKDCSTQRNLSQTGIEQSVKIGDKLRAVGISEAQVFTSQWCRCIDTAVQLGLGEPVEFPLINSFFRDFEKGPINTQALREWLKEQDLSKPLVLVTHQVNITALTDIFPSSGEMIIIKRESDGELTVTGRVQTN